MGPSSSISLLGLATPVGRTLSDGVSPLIRSTTATWLAVTLTLLNAVARSAPPAPDGPGRQPEVWAVLVGIDLYNDPAIPRCHGANRDGGALARWFTETAEWATVASPAVERVRAPASWPARGSHRALSPTRENMNSALTQWLGHRAGQATSRSSTSPANGRRGRPDPALADRCPGRRPSSIPAGLPRRPSTSSRRGRAAGSSSGSTPRRPGGLHRPGAEPDPYAGVRLLNRLSRWPGVTAWLAADGQPAAEGPATRALPLRPRQRARRPSEQPGRMPRPYVRRPDPEEAGVPGPGGHLSPGDPLAGLVPARASVPAGTAPAQWDTRMR